MRSEGQVGEMDSLLIEDCTFHPQDAGLSENEHQLSVAGKIKKHFNTSPKPSDNTSDMDVIMVRAALSHQLYDLKMSHSNYNHQECSFMLYNCSWESGCC